LIASLRAALAERAIDAKPGSGAESVDSSPNGAAIASSARHELNNQLAIMRMFADVLALSPGLTPEQIAKAREIAAAADRATQIVRRLTGGHHRSRD
jgi:signal transduction histidine kinase